MTTSTLQPHYGTVSPSILADFDPLQERDQDQIDSHETMSPTTSSGDGEDHIDARRLASTLNNMHPAIADAIDIALVLPSTTMSYRHVLYTSR